MSSTIYIDEIPNSVLQDIEGNENFYVTFDLNTEIEEVVHTDHWCYSTDMHYTKPEYGCVAQDIESVEIESINRNQAVQLSSDQLKGIMDKLHEYVDNAEKIA